ncbi:MAG: hypothetical protein BAX61_03055 [Psychrobacter sp. B29-1]|uniref:hypothetical protein n=1 Tax=Psychrobacter sp. B29-1 TaxID=1867800 RepID=UPI00086EF42B|nr:hypothetical protein [Psychrobacter sp. B29-1]OEH69179.1 MAG: hypothetical protein BAX61_03055 [Psychrobacter sp. B29-1]
MTDIEIKTEWVDKAGEIMEVLHVDYDKNELRFKWLNNPNRKRERVISIDKFLRYAVPVIRAKEVSDKPEPVKENPAKPGQQFISVWDGESQLNFGQSPNLQLSNQDWLEQGMHAKTVKFNIGAGGLPPEVNWEDHCAAIAMIDDKPAKALASILLWGSDTNWNWSRHFDEVVQYLAANMIERCNKDKRAAPQACTHSLPELARLMARMVLHFELYELWDVYTVKGRLQFSGIKINVNTYSHAWLTYQRQMLQDLFDMVVNADHYVSTYRKELSAAQ